MLTKMEVVREFYRLLERQETDQILDLVDPELEFDVSANVFNPAVWRGREGLSTWFEQASEVWLPPRIEVVSIEELPDGRLYSAIVVENVGRESGLPVTMPFWQVWTFRDDAVVVHIAHFNEEAPARELAGLSS